MSETSRALFQFGSGRGDVPATVTDPVAGIVHKEWGFKDVNTTELTHGIHPYPARLVPQVARKLLKRYAKPNNLVWDPFCGSGTVLLESMTHNYRSVGTDLNPFACLLARTKTTVVPAKQLTQWSEMIVTRLRAPGTEKARMRYQPVVTDFTLDVGRWWQPAVVRDLAFIQKQISEVPEVSKNPVLANLLDVAFSRTVRTVSNQRPNEFKRYRRTDDDLKAFAPDTVSEFLRRWSAVCKMVMTLTPKYNDSPKPDVVTANCSTYTPREKVDLIVTSPPYGDSTTTVAYGQYSSLMMEWLPSLESDWREVDKNSLGGNPAATKTRSVSETLKGIMDQVEKKDQQRAKSVETFFGDMRDCLSHFYDCLEPKGVACIVIGDRTVREVTVPNATIITEDSVDLGFEHVQTLSRRIFFKVNPYRTNPVGRSGQDQDTPTIGKESIVILRRES